MKQIGFHTLRHWKATILYYQTKDILHIKEFLGHKKVETTLLFIQLAETIFQDLSDEFTVKVASKTEEIKALRDLQVLYMVKNRIMRLIKLSRDLTNLLQRRLSQYLNDHSSENKLAI